MSKIEKEVKVLDINVNETIDKLKKMGAEYKGFKEQKIYTYDIPTIYFRFLETRELLKSDNELLINTTLKKLSTILDEFADLVDDEILDKIYIAMGVNNFSDLLKYDSKKIFEILNNCELFNQEISNYLINPNKWIRLRKSNDKIELTVKHVYEKENGKLQKVQEYEIKVSDLDETNQILESIGVVKRNYQEKLRHSFEYNDAEIEIDQWPLLEPYMEIECDDETLIQVIINKLEFNNKEVVSLNTEQLYKRKNIDVLKISDLKF